MYDKLRYTNSAELCDQMAAECDTAILSFSCGKDSIAAWLQMRDHFKKIVPYYLYLVPRLDFVEDSLRYYEDFFQTRIYRLPHPSLYRWMRLGIFATPPRVAYLETLEIPAEDYTENMVGDMVRSLGNLPAAAYVGIGIRAADSPQRQMMLKMSGSIDHAGKRFFPVYDWRKADVVKAIRDAGVKLPVDYRIWGRTFDGIDYRFLAPLREHFPDDYQRVLEWFPLADLEMFRRGERHGILG